MDYASADFEAFYSDFAVEVTIDGASAEGVFSKEEVETVEVYGVQPVFRTQFAAGEGQQLIHGARQYQVKAIQPLEYGESLLILELVN